MNADVAFCVEGFCEAFGVRRVIASLSHQEWLDLKRCEDAPHSQSTSCESWQTLLKEEHEC